MNLTIHATWPKFHYVNVQAIYIYIYILSVLTSSKYFWWLSHCVWIFNIVMEVLGEKRYLISYTWPGPNCIYTVHVRVCACVSVHHSPGAWEPICRGEGGMDGVSFEACGRQAQGANYSLGSHSPHVWVHLPWHSQPIRSSHLRSPGLMRAPPQHKAGLCLTSPLKWDP